jgi:ligand-binding sensor domain-containing protein
MKRIGLKVRKTLLRLINSTIYYSLAHNYTYLLKSSLTLIVLSFILKNSLAQENDLRFNYITTNNGLSNNIVTCIAQDENGFMWIGTMEGLNHFDGYKNKIFKKVLDDSTSLADNMVFDIYIDHLTNIWVGTQNGLCLYNSD